MTEWPPWRFLAQLVARRPVFWSLNVTSIILLSVLETGPGLIARSFFDWLAAGDAEWQTLWWLLALLGGLALARVTFMVGCQATNMPFMLQNAALLQRNMLGSTLELPGAAGLPHSSGEAISRFRDDVDDTTILPIGFNDMLAWAAFAAVGFAIMLSISPLITLVVVVPLLVLVSVINAARTRIETYRRDVRAATGEVTAFLAEVFAATSTITASAAEERTIQRFRALNRIRLEAMVRDRVFDQVLQSISRNVSNLGTGVILLLVADSIGASSFTLGDFAIFVFYLGWVGEFTNQFGIVMALYRRSAVSFSRMSELLGGAHPSRLVLHLPARPGRFVPPNEPLKLLRIDGLTYLYPDSRRGIRNVSLSVARGECVVVTGRVWQNDVATHRDRSAPT
jgi:ATP-binding cassette, subfamily B, bacterial